MQSEFVETYFGKNRDIQRFAYDALVRGRSDVAKEVNRARTCSGSACCMPRARGCLCGDAKSGEGAAAVLELEGPRITGIVAAASALPSVKYFAACVDAATVLPRTPPQSPR